MKSQQQYKLHLNSSPRLELNKSQALFTRCKQLSTEAKIQHHSISRLQNTLQLQNNQVSNHFKNQKSLTKNKNLIDVSQPCISENHLDVMYLSQVNISSQFQNAVINKQDFNKQIQKLTEMVQKQIQQNHDNNNINLKSKNKKINIYNKNDNHKNNNKIINIINNNNNNNDNNNNDNNNNHTYSHNFHHNHNQNHKQQFKENGQMKENKKYQNINIIRRGIGSLGNQIENPLSYLKIEQVLGNGKFSSVRLVSDKRTGMKFGLKVMNKQMIQQYKIQQQIVNEIKIQSMINHPNILKLYSFFQDEQNVYLLLEYCPQGNLYNYMKQQQLSEQNVANIITQVVGAVQTLHLKDIIHRDIKPENILISFDQYKLCDLGCSVYSPKDYRDTLCGTLDYLSPELAKGQSYSYHVDLWAIGILAYELLMKQPPFLEQNRSNQVQTLNNIISAPIQFKSSCSNEFKDFIYKILNKDPLKRLDTQQILDHAWIKKNNQAKSVNLHL